MQFELANSAFRPRPFRLAIFDFDGTVSLIREGWSKIMARQATERLGDESRFDEIELEMLRLSGKPSIFQMRRLAEILNAIGVIAPEPEQMLAEFNERLTRMTAERIKGLKSGNHDPSQWAVPGSHRLLSYLQSRGVTLVLASGTPMEYLKPEAELLGYAPIFGDRIFGPEGSSPNFSKRDVIEFWMRELNIPGKDLIGFGDGFSETVEVKRVDGTAIGVASREAGTGGVNPMKRAMLLELGADAIIPDYTDLSELFRHLFGE